MNIMSYLLTLCNLKALGGPDYQLQDIAVKVDTVERLKEMILDTPGFAIEDFKDQGYHRAGAIGIYASNYLRQYLFQGNVNPKHEATVITIWYEPRTSSESLESEESQLHLLVRRKGLSEKQAKDYLKRIDVDHCELLNTGPRKTISMTKID